MSAIGREHARPDVDPWRARAACIGHTDLFYETSTEARSACRDLCASCPVKAECIEWAIDTVTAYEVAEGIIFGGVSARTIKRWRARRKALAGAMAPIDHGTYAGAAAHYNRAERPCELCLAAKRDYEFQRRERAS